MPRSHLAEIGYLRPGITDLQYRVVDIAGDVIDGLDLTAATDSETVPGISGVYAISLELPDVPVRVEWYQGNGDDITELEFKGSETVLIPISLSIAENVLFIRNRMAAQVPGSGPVIIWPAPTDPALVQVMVDLARFGMGQSPSLQGIKIKMKLDVPEQTKSNGQFVVPVTVTELSDGDGRSFFELAPTPPNCYWRAMAIVNNEEFLLARFSLGEDEAQVDIGNAIS